MADLKVCLQKAGLRNVSTLLQSGNVIFESGLEGAQLKQTIESALTKSFKYPAKVQVLPLETLQKIIDQYPFGNAGDAQHDYVIFMENGLEEDLVTEQDDLAPGEQIQAGKGVVYWRVDKGSTLKSAFAKQLTRAKYKDCNTNRNLKTLRKIVDAT